MNRSQALNFYSKYKIFIFPAVVTLSSLFLIVFLILPETVKLVTNQRVGSELLNKFSSIEVKAQKLEEYNQEDLSQKVQYALRVYPTEKDYEGILGVLQAVAVRSGFNLGSFSLQGESQIGSQNYGVSVTFSGLKSLIPTLLSSIENADRIIRVNKIDLSENAQQVELDLALSVLYGQLPGELGSVDAPLPQLSQEEDELLVKLAVSQPQPVVEIPTEEPIIEVPRGKINPFE